MPRSLPRWLPILGVFLVIINYKESSTKFFEEESCETDTNYPIAGLCQRLPLHASTASLYKEKGAPSSIDLRRTISSQPKHAVWERVMTEEGKMNIWTITSTSLPIAKWKKDLPKADFASFKVKSVEALTEKLLKQKKMPHLIILELDKIPTNDHPDSLHYEEVQRANLQSLIRAANDRCTDPANMLLVDTSEPSDDFASYTYRRVLHQLAQYYGVGLIVTPKASFGHAVSYALLDFALSYCETEFHATFNSSLVSDATQKRIERILPPVLDGSLTWSTVSPAWKQAEVDINQRCLKTLDN